MNLRELVEMNIKRMPYGFIVINLIVCIICGVGLTSGLLVAVRTEALNLGMGAMFLIAAFVWFTYIIVKAKDK